MPTEYETGGTCIYCGVERSLDWMYRIAGTGRSGRNYTEPKRACLRPTGKFLTESQAEFEARLAAFDKVHPLR